MRADARRNRRRLLDAACALYLELGLEAPLEAIARRAGVGVATLYRHFGDRSALLREVAVDVLNRAERDARAALDEPDAFTALRRYMHTVLDGCVPALMPLVSPAVRDVPEVKQLLDTVAALQSRLIDNAKDRGVLHPDVEFADIGLGLARFSRPIGGDMDPEAELAIAHRHLDVFIRGLRPDDAGGLPGPALTLAELRAMRET